MMSAESGPYRVEEIRTPQGSRWRLVGPGLEGNYSYPWSEFREKLADLAELMNFAWKQARGGGSGGSSGMETG
jgi:hypothetical protein